MRTTDTTTAVTYDRSAEGAVKVAGAEIRAWRVGTFEFAQVLHIVAVEPVEDSRPKIRFAAVVERRNWKHRRIGWSPRRAIEFKVPVKGTPPVCPVDH